VFEDEEDEDDYDFDSDGGYSLPISRTEEECDEEDLEEDSDPRKGEQAPQVNDTIPPPPVAEEQPDELPFPENKEEEELVIPQSLTNEAWEKASESLVQKVDEEYIYVNYPTPLYESIFDDYKKVLADYRMTMASSPNTMKSARHQLAVWRKREKETISYMVKEFETKKAADLHARTRISKVGVIDTNKLHAYRTSEDLFRRLSITPGGKNHGFFMVLDWSSSMIDNIHKTARQLMSLVLFCKQIGVPFEVCTFWDGYFQDASFNNVEDNTIKMGRLKLRNILSSRMNSQDFTDAMTYLWIQANGRRLDNMNTTPLNEALFVLPKYIEDFKKKHHLQVVNTVILTDGHSNGNGSLANETNKYAKRHFFLNDPVTKKTHDLGSGYSRIDTEMLLERLKDITKCNLIGFFLHRGGKQIEFDVVGLFEDAVERQKALGKWHQDGFFSVTNRGYDQYYYINARAVSDLSKEDFEVKDTIKTVRGLSTAFLKYANKKKTNRVLLRNFIDNIVDINK
jgi:hypothetical protein